MVEQLGGAQADEATGPTLLLMPSSSALSLYSSGLHVKFLQRILWLKIFVKTLLYINMDSVDVGLHQTEVRM